MPEFMEKSEGAEFFTHKIGFRYADESCQA